jgi:hypothetical protein
VEVVQPEHRFLPMRLRVFAWALVEPLEAKVALGCRFPDRVGLVKLAMAIRLEQASPLESSALGIWWELVVGLRQVLFPCASVMWGLAGFWHHAKARQQALALEDACPLSVN